MTDERLEEIRQHAAKNYDTPSFEVEELIAEIDRLKGDSAIVDWIERQSWANMEKDALGWIVWPRSDRSGPYHETLREAFATAMAGTKEETD